MVSSVFLLKLLCLFLIFDLFHWSVFVMGIYRYHSSDPNISHSFKEFVGDKVTTETLTSKDCCCLLLNAQRI